MAGPSESESSDEETCAFITNINLAPLLAQKSKDLASLVVSSGLLNQLWDAISDTKIHFKDQLLGSDLRLHFEVKELTKYKVIVFLTSPITKNHLLEKRELVSSSTVSDFEFVRSSRGKPSFSINKAALSLFDSRKGELYQLVAQIAKAHVSKPYIITGDGIGGSMASLFTLWLLYFWDKETPHLCVTFGSPLLGYCDIERAIAKYSTWKDFFLHVVSVDDGFPSLFVLPNHPTEGNSSGKTSTYYPFGRFLFCSRLGDAYFVDPKSALVLLRKTSAEIGENEQSYDYGPIIASLRNSLIFKDKTDLNGHGTGLSRENVSLAAEYLAGLFQLQDVGRESQLDGLLKGEMSVLDQRRQAFPSAEEVFNMEIHMSYIEWYKKYAESDGISYYDSYKSQLYSADRHITRYKVILQNFWDQQVEEVEKKPPKVGETSRNHCLLSGTIYRRLVEPLAIADYYIRKNARNYIIEGRSEDKLKHYIQLEQWFTKDEVIPINKENKSHFPPVLTEDSCFWAHVEEAIISCDTLTKEESVSSSIEDLKDFEKYVLELIKNYKVSSDIFLETSSFMRWWKEYEEVLDKKLMGTSYASPLSDLMRNQIYKKYLSGSLVL